MPTTSGPNWWLVGLVVLIPLGASIPIAKRVRRRRRLRRVQEGDVTAAWDEIVDRLADLGDPVRPTLTPIEVARATDPALIPLATRYAAAVYGGKTDQARESDLFGAELWLENSYDRRSKMLAAMNPRSLSRSGW